jgi:hypothetical protein
VVDSRITAAGMEKLKRLNKLEWVSLKSAVKLGNSGFAHLPVKKLVYLNLEETAVTGRGIASLSGAKQLQFLSLSGRTADAGLKHLRKLKNLRRLRVGGMVVNEADMKEILHQSKHLQQIESDWGWYTRKGWKEEPDLAESLKSLNELRKKLQKRQ